MCSSISWEGTSLKICNIDVNQDLIAVLKKEVFILREDEDCFILEDQSNCFICEDDFIAKSKNLPVMIRKYLKKEYGETAKMYLPHNVSFSEISIDVSDKGKYSKILKTNIIDGEERELSLSINALNTVLKNNESSKTFLDILILFLLATKSSYDAETVTSEFQIEEKKHIVQLDITNPKPLYLFPLYDWIVNDEEYEESYNVKLHIVRQVIVNKKDIKDVEGILEDSKLAYKRIISKKTDDYFDQLNQLKDDFLILSKNENNALRTLNLTFFAWLGYLGIELFKIITNYKGSDIINFLLCSKGPKKGIVIFMFAVALSFIYIAYVSEIKSLGKTYEIIKKIYKDKILFETDSDDVNKFESTIKKPEIGCKQKNLFLAIIVALIVRFFLTFPWY